MNHAEQHVVAIFGAYDASDDGRAYETARAVGYKLAQLGYTVANGGYGGLMEASARGAKEAGGTTIGVVSSIWKMRPNAYIDRVIWTGPLGERTSKLLELGVGGYVALDGATGTLEELATAWNMLAVGAIPRRPLVCVGDFWRPLLELMAQARPQSSEFIAAVRNAAEIERFFPQRLIS